MLRLNWYDVWALWHTTICHHTGYIMKKDGLGFRKNQFWHNLQLPICSWLDKKAHTGAE